MIKIWTLYLMTVQVKYYSGKKQEYSTEKASKFSMI